MAVTSLTASISYSTSINVELYAVPNNSVAVEYNLKDLNVNLIGSATSSGKLDLKLYAIPDNSVVVEYNLQSTVKLTGSGLSSGSIKLNLYQPPDNQATVNYNLKDLNLLLSSSGISSGKLNFKLYAAPNNMMAVDYTIFMPKTNLHGSAVTSGLIQPFPFGLEGSAVTSGQARALRQLKTSLIGSITATSSTSKIMLEDYINISGSTITSGQLKALRQLKISLAVSSTTLAEIIPPNQLRTDLIGRINVDGQVDPLLHRLTKLTGHAEFNLDILFPENYYYYDVEMKAGIDRTQKYNLSGDFGIKRENLYGVDLDLGVERIRLFKFQLIYSDSRILGDVIYPYAAKNNMKELIMPKSYAEIETNAGNITFDWGMTLQDSRIIEEWDYMEEYFYEQLRDLFEANNGANIYDYQFNNTEKYRVEIVDFDGQPYREGYYQNVSLILKPLEKIIL